MYEEKKILIDIYSTNFSSRRLVHILFFGSNFSLASLPVYSETREREEKKTRIFRNIISVQTE